MTEEEFRQIQDNQARAGNIVTGASYAAGEILESSIQRECVKLLEQDGWRALRTDPVSDRGRGKGFGELGMADYLFVRYDGMSNVLEISEPIPEATEVCVQSLCQVLWVEFKRPRGGVVSKSQTDWHNKERARGALTWIASQDFPATVEGFREHYEASGLMRRERWW